MTAVLSFSSFRIDLADERLWRDEQAIALRPKTWAVLRYLAERPGQLVTKDELFDAVWGDTAVEEKSLNVSIAELRRVLGDDARAPRFIETVHRRGFRFIAGAGPRPPQADVDPIPDTQHPTPLFVGRTVELGALRALVDTAAAGHGQLAFVCGEAGIGKTRLVEQVIDYAGRAAFRTLIGRTIQAESAPPYWPWVEILRAWISALDDGALRRAASSGAANLGRLLPVLSNRLPDLATVPTDDPESARVRLFEAVSAFVINAADECPHLLVLEDLHWADEPSLLLLQFLTRDIAHSRVAIIATCREPEGAAPHPAGKAMAALARDGLRSALSASPASTRLRRDRWRASCWGLRCRMPWSTTWRRRAKAIPSSSNRSFDTSQNWAWSIRSMGIGAAACSTACSCQPVSLTSLSGASIVSARRVRNGSGLPR